MSLLSSAQPIPAADIVPIRDLVLHTAGMFFEERRFYFIEKRIQKRMQVTHSSSAKEYYRLLKLGSSGELDHLLEELTTNETYFYRNLPQLDSFTSEALPLLIEEKRKRGNLKLRFWSAACSSGEEPYTLVMMVKEMLPDFSLWQFEIVATDLDTQILAKAKAGIYEQRAVKDVPPAILSRYFEQQDRKFLVTEEIKQHVTFRPLNLMDRQGMQRMQGFDSVFCRNVLIYFDEDSRKRVVSSIYDALSPGGFIFLGHSESVGKLSAAFKPVKFKKSLSYRK